MSTTFADEMEREKPRARTRDAMTRKARAGYVTGGRKFGYVNVEVRPAQPGHGQPCAPDGGGFCYQTVSPVI